LTIDTWVIKGGPTKGIGRFDKGGLDFGSGCKCRDIYSDEGEAGEGEACEVDGVYLPAVISSCRSLASNWAGVICDITRGGDKDDSEEDEDLKDDDKGGSL
jgi:hypothetical protein